MTTFDASPANSSTQTRRPIEVDPIDPSLPFPKYSAAVRDRPQAAWRTLDAARRGAFTGELVFETSPAIFVYVDGGDVYWAGRDDDAMIGRQLVDAGILDEDQLRRSSMTVGGVAHLGRMFELDETIDRGAVLVEIERSTARIVETLVSSVVSTATTTAYRHHPAGIRAWFSRIGIDHPVRVNTPRDLDDIPVTEAAGGRADWDGELSTLTRERTLTAIAPEPTDATETTTTTTTAAPTSSPSTTSTRRPLFSRTSLPRLRLDRTDRDAERAARRAGLTRREHSSVTADEVFRRSTGSGGSADVPETDDRATAEDGSVPVAHGGDGPPSPPTQPSLPTPSPSVPTRAAAPTPTSTTPPAVPSTPPAAQSGHGESTPRTPTGPTPPAPGTPVTTGGGELPAPTGPVHLTSLPAPDAVVPDSVAHAVRRALDAIEIVSAPQGGVLSLLESTTRRPSQPDADVEPSPDVVRPPASSPFAPPTPDMRAEAVYARAAAAADAGHTADPLDDDGGGSGRTKALRRLIGSLRRP